MIGAAREPLQRDGECNVRWVQREGGSSQGRPQRKGRCNHADTGAA